MVSLESPYEMRYGCNWTCSMLLSKQNFTFVAISVCRCHKNNCSYFYQENKMTIMRLNPSPSLSVGHKSQIVLLTGTRMQIAYVFRAIVAKNLNYYFDISNDLERVKFNKQINDSSFGRIFLVRKGTSKIRNDKILKNQIIGNDCSIVGAMESSAPVFAPKPYCTCVRFKVISDDVTVIISKWNIS